MLTNINIPCSDIRTIWTICDFASENSEIHIISSDYLVTQIQIHCPDVLFAS